MRHTQEQLRSLATAARLEVLRLWKINRAPLSGALSIVDVYTTMFFEVYDLGESPKRKVRLVPKTTSVNALYGVAATAGLIPSGTPCTIDEFPPIPRKGVWFSDAGVHKLGTNLDQGVGHALAGKLANETYDVVVCLSDGELQCGVDHQAKLAATWRLDNLIVVLDNNGLQSNYEVQRADSTLDGGRAGRCLRAIWEACGWDYTEVDGHDYAEVYEAFQRTKAVSRPSIIVARTVKGKGVPRFEGRFGYDHLASPEEIEQAEAHLRGSLGELPALPWPAGRRGNGGKRPEPEPLSVPDSSAYDTANVRMAVPLEQWLTGLRDQNPGRVLILNTDNPVPFDRSTPVHSADVPSPHVFVGINERVAIGIARGLANEGLFPIYLSPAVHLQVCGEEFIHAGLDRQRLLVIGFYPALDLAHWGVSHAGYRDVTLFSAPGVSVFQPAGPDDLLIILGTIYRSPSQWLPAYLRMPRRGRTDLLTRAGEASFRSSMRHGFYVLDDCADDRFDAVIVGSGRVINECLEAADELNRLGTATRVINVLNLKHVDSSSFQRAVGRPGALISCIEAESSTFQATLLEALDPVCRGSLLSLGLGGTPRGFSREAVLEEFHMDPEQLISSVRQQLGGYRSRSGVR